MIEMTFALWSLTTRALTTSVLMLWTYVSATNLVEGFVRSSGFWPSLATAGAVGTRADAGGRRGDSQVAEVARDD